MSKKMEGYIIYIVSVFIIVIAISIPLLYYSSYDRNQLDLETKVNVLEASVDRLEKKVTHIITKKKRTYYVEQLKEGVSFHENNWLKNYLQLSSSQLEKLDNLHKEYSNNIKKCKEEQVYWYWLNLLENMRPILTERQNKNFYELLTK